MINAVSAIFRPYNGGVPNKMSYIELNKSLMTVKRFFLSSAVICGANDVIVIQITIAVHMEYFLNWKSGKGRMNTSGYK